MPGWHFDSPGQPALHYTLGGYTFVEYQYPVGVYTT